MKYAIALLLSIVMLFSNSVAAEETDVVAPDGRAAFNLEQIQQLAEDKKDEVVIKGTASVLVGGIWAIAAYAGAKAAATAVAAGTVTGVTFASPGVAATTAFLSGALISYGLSSMIIDIGQKQQFQSAKERLQRSKMMKNFWKNNPSQKPESPEVNS
jgi:hypothetical protein